MISHDWALLHDLSSIPRPAGQFWLPLQVLERVWIPSSQLVLHSLHVIHCEKARKIMTSYQKSCNLTYFFIRTKRSILTGLICSFAWFASYIQRLIRNTDHWFYLWPWILVWPESMNKTNPQFSTHFAIRQR